MIDHHGLSITTSQAPMELMAFSDNIVLLSTPPQGLALVETSPCSDASQL